MSSDGNSKIWVACFDIGKKNFAFNVDEIDTKSLLNLEPIPLNKRYMKNGTPTSDFYKTLTKVSKSIKTLKVENKDLTEGCNKKEYLDPRTYINMYNVLDSYKHIWDKCSVFIIEQQMSFGHRKNNTMALKLGQHCYSYFLFNYGVFKEVVEFPAYHKTKVLGAPKKMSKPERKDWAVEKAMSLLSQRGDMDIVDKLSSRKKRDDMSDCVLMSVSFSILTYLDKIL